MLSEVYSLKCLNVAFLMWRLFFFLYLWPIFYVVNSMSIVSNIVHMFWAIFLWNLDTVIHQKSYNTQLKFSSNNNCFPLKFSLHTTFSDILYIKIQYTYYKNSEDGLLTIRHPKYKRNFPSKTGIIHLKFQ